MRTQKTRLPLLRSLNFSWEVEIGTATQMIIQGENNALNRNKESTKDVQRREIFNLECQETLYILQGA